MSGNKPNPSVSKYDYLFLPIETKNREFYAKLLLSCFAAEGGFTVVLGEQQELRSAIFRFPRGIYIDKSVVKSKSNFFRLLKAMGHKITAWCEEGLIYPNPEIYLSQRISTKSFKLLDAFFAWGNIHAGHIQSKAKGINIPVLPTGNPRIDLLRDPFRKLYFEQATKLKEIYGQFLLINTNFSFYNHVYSPEFRLQRWQKRGRIKRETEIKEYWGKVDFTRRVFESFIEMINAIANQFKETKIIVRPHPSENHEKWRELTKSLPNVSIIYEGSALTWIAAAEAIIHNGCTTGLEAFLMGKPVLAYMAERSDTYERKLPNDVSIQCFSLNELIAYLKNLLAGNMDPLGNMGKQLNIAQQYLSSLEGRFASERIVETLKGISMNSKNMDNNMLTRIKLLISKLKNFTFFVRKKLRIRKKHSLQKFDELTMEEVLEGIRTFQRLSGRFAGITAQKIKGTKNTYSIAKNV